jgi:3-isopropylmalate/(R)-2-methylmalate dehydratase small subunit
VKIIIRGAVFKVGDDINTDSILPAKYLDLYEPADLAPHAFEGMGPEILKRMKDRTIVVGGENFGMGSAREQAPNALKGAGIQAVIAKSFARIFYRNTINVGIAAVESPGAVEAVAEGEEMTIEIETGTIRVRDEKFSFPPFPQPVRDLLLAGGMTPLLRRKLNLV